MRSDATDLRLHESKHDDQVCSSRHASCPETGVASFAHGGKVGVVVEFGFERSESESISNAQQVADRKVIGASAENASAVVSVEYLRVSCHVDPRKCHRPQRWRA